MAFGRILRGAAAAFIDLRLLKRLAVPVAAVSALLLILVIIPQVGKEVNGSRRWLELGPIVAQPSDLAKFALIIFLSSYLYDNQRKLKTFSGGLFKPLMIVGLFCGPIILEPDYGTTFLCGFVGLILIFLAGAKISHIAAVFVPLGAAFCTVIYFNPVRMARIFEVSSTLREPRPTAPTSSTRRYSRSVPAAYSERA